MTVRGAGVYGGPTGPVRSPATGDTGEPAATRHSVMVDGGRRVEFELHQVPGGDLRVDAPGVAPLRVRSLDEARAAVRYHSLVASRPASYRGWC